MGTHSQNIKAGGPLDHSGPALDNFLKPGLHKNYPSPTVMWAPKVPPVLQPAILSIPYTWAGKVPSEEK